MRSFYLFFLLIPVLILTSCSTSQKVITPDMPAAEISNSSMQDWGDYGLKFDPVSGKVDILYGREVEGVHYEITSFLNPPACGGSGCITASLVAWDAVNQIATFNVTITNPSMLMPSDVRMIFYWLGTKRIVNADSYTRAFVGTIQPFIAFGKANPNRVFPGGAAITESVQIYWPPMSPFSIYFRVSAWLWLNCNDPYEINGMFQAGVLKPSGGNATIGCNVLDWQNDVTQVTVNTALVTGGSTVLSFMGGTLWQANITNSTGAAPGSYGCLITAKSPNPQNFDLYNLLTILISPNAWTPVGTWGLPPGQCSLDFGIMADGNAAVPAGSAIINVSDPTGACNQIQIYPGGWANAPYIYASLLNLDPTNPAFQPWPVVRLDAADDGAFGWTNNNSNRWRANPFVSNINTWCNFDNQPKFIWNPEADDHRHYMLWQNEVLMFPVDTCDTFKAQQCALYVETGMGLVGFQGIPGAPHGFDYTDADMVWEAFFPGALVGRGPGQVDPSDISGIDCMQGPEEKDMLVFIALKNNMRVEVYKITDVGPGPVDIVAPVLTIWVMHPQTNGGQPVDIELLPSRNGYDKNPGREILCVLINNAATPYPPPGIGGSVWIYDAMTGNFVDEIGSFTQPAVFNTPAFLDTDDSMYSVHVMQFGPQVTQFNYF